MKNRCSHWIRQRRGTAEIIFRRAKGRDLLEDGRTDDRSDISERAASKSGHKRKWRGGRSHHQQCEGIRNLPLQIPYQGELILRGEAVIGYKDLSVSTSRSRM
mgnify:CR=1 FL=1